MANQDTVITESQRPSIDNEKGVVPSAPLTPSGTVKKKPGASWKANEEQHLPENRLYIVFSGLMLCVFLAALGKSIASIQIFEWG